MLERMKRMAEKLGLRLVLWRAKPGEIYEAWLPYKNMRLTLSAINLDELGCNRAGLVDVGKHRVRTSPCQVVFDRFYIDWNGSVVPCSNIRSDSDKHQAYIVDKLTLERSVFDAYANSALVDWRRKLAGWGPKASPCDDCRTAELADTRRFRQLSESIVQANGLTE